MWALVWILIGLGALGVPVLILTLIVRAGQRGAGGGTAPGAPVRRFFQYWLMLVALLLAAYGVSGLIRAAAVGSDLLGGRSQVAGPLSAVVVALPLFLVLAGWTRRRLESDPDERRSIGWLLYITVASVTALAVTMNSLIGAISNALGDADRPAGLWVNGAVWGAIWWAHWVAGRHFIPPDEGRSHRFIGSLLGLWGMLGSVAGAGVVVAEAAYYELFGSGLITSVATNLRGFVGPFVVSTAVWWWYWYQHTRSERATTGRQAYVLLGGVLVGLLAVLVAVGAILFSILRWFLIDSGDTALDNFAPFPAALVIAAVGWLSWDYHRRVADRTEAGRVGEVRRTYAYLLAGVGLVAMVVALTFLVAAAIEAMVGGAVLSIFDGSRLALWGLTLGIVGIPLWWRAWSSVQGRGPAGVDERTLPARRLYLSASFGVGALFALIALITVATRVFEDLFDGGIDGQTIYDARWSLAIVVALGAMAAYHWRVFRSDREAEPARTGTFERLLLIAPGEAAALG
ncbi:MAG TPA: DUF5671 domain-containing protein, partial [Acidimicrobiia bacterium]|nr:DUF5671 domain-containing protein [Acidimicrobiia bacterium]